MKNYYNLISRLWENGRTLMQTRTGSARTHQYMLEICSRYVACMLMVFVLSIANIGMAWGDVLWQSDMQESISGVTITKLNNSDTWATGLNLAWAPGLPKAYQPSGSGRGVQLAFDTPLSLQSGDIIRVFAGGTNNTERTLSLFLNDGGSAVGTVSLPNGTLRVLDYPISSATTLNKIKITSNNNAVYIFKVVIFRNVPATGTTTIIYEMRYKNKDVQGRTDNCISTITGLSSAFTLNGLTTSTSNGIVSFCGEITGHPTSEDNTKNVDLQFTIANGYTFTPSSVSFKWDGNNSTVKAKVTITDGTTTVTSNESTASGSPSVSNAKSFSFASGAFDGKTFTGTVHIKVHIWSSSTGKRAFILSPFSLTGTVASAAPTPACGETEQTALSLSPSSGTICGTGTTTFTVSGGSGDGALSVSSLDPSKATASIDGTTVTVTGVAAGSATITVTKACDATYAEATATYSATVAAVPTANAGVDQTTEPETGVALAATAAASGCTGAWTIQSGPNMATSQLSSTSSATATFTPTVAGTYTLRWTVTNTSSSCSAYDEMKVTAATCAISSCGNATITYTINASTDVTNTAANLLSANPDVSNTTALGTPVAASAVDLSTIGISSDSNPGKAAAKTSTCYPTAPTMSSKIGMFNGEAYSSSNYLQFSFTVKTGYTFTPCDIEFTVQPVDVATSFRWEVTDGTNVYGYGTATDVPTGSDGGASVLTGLTSTAEMEAGTYYIRLYPYVNAASKTFRISNNVILKGTTAAAGPVALATTNPTDATYVKGATATALSVTASGGTSPYSYQWYSCDDDEKTNAAPISGATSSSYTPSNTATGYYYCTVTDAASATVSSAVATVTIRNAAAPTASPVAGAVASGTEITLTSSDGGTIYYTTDGTTPTDASTAYDAGAKPAITEATTIKAVAKVNGYLGDVMTASYTISAVPVLTALVPGTRYDVADMVPDGTTITSSDQFVDGLSENTKFELIGTGSGATGSTMKVKNDAKTVDGIEFANSYYFGTGATLSSNTPTDYAIKFIVPSAGTITAWLRNSSAIKLAKEGVAGTVFGSGDSKTYDKYTLTVASSGTYYIYATGGSTTLYGLKFLADATVYSVSADPVSGDVCSGNTATITLSGSQSGVNYQLYKGESTVGDAKAGTSSALSWTGIDAAGTYTIKSVANASYNASAMSGSVTISILAATAISTQPTEPIVVTLGDAAEIAITATGEGDLTYEWYTCNSDGTGATKIEAAGDLSFSGYTTATLGLTPIADGSTYYKCTVTGTCGSATTNVIEVQAAEQYDITHTLTNIIKVSGEAKATAGSSYTAVYRRTVGYTLPAAVTVTRGETDITTSCTWNSSTGTLTIPSAQISDDITITVTGTAVECPDASNTETLFLYEPKTSLSDADISAGTYTFYDAAPGDYLQSVSGGFVTLYVPSAGDIRIHGNQLAFNSSNSYVKIELDCELQAKDRITVTSSGNAGDLWISLDDSKLSKETDATAVITQGTPYRIPAGSDLIGVSTIYFWRSSSTTQIGQVQIVRPETAYDITTSATNGTITTQVSGAAVVDAVKNAQVDISATGNTGYQFSSWSIYKTDDAGTTVTPNAATASTYFTMPQYDVTVSATFSLIDYTVTHSAATNGSYTIKVGDDSPVSTNTNANYGQTVTLGASPADGYAFSSWTVTGATSGDNIVVDSNNQFVMPAEAVTISASFAKLYTVSAGSHTNGSITLTPTTAVAGTTISIAATGDLSYVFSSWTIVDGESTNLTSTLLGANSTTASTSFTMPAYDVTVSAAFEVDNNDYTVSFSAGTGGGTVPDSESGKIGSSFTVPGVGSMTAPTSKLFKGWLSDDDVFYPSGTTYTITGDATLTAVWDGNGSSVTLSWFETSQHNNSSNKPDSRGKYIYGYTNSAMTDGYAYTITTANTNNKGQNSGVDMFINYGTSIYIYSDNTTTGGTPSTFSNVTAVTLKLKNKHASKYSTLTIKVGSTTIADAVSLSGANNSTYTLYEYTGLSNLSGLIEIYNGGSGSTDYNFYIDDITITCGVLATGKTVTFDNQTGFNGTTTLPNDIEGIPSGSKILRPETDPSASGYTFGGWYKEAACTNVWDFATDEVDDDITLYAKWDPILLTAVSIDNLDLNVGFSGTPAVTKTPANALASADWSIVDGDSYISINSETGEVTAIAPGTAHVNVVMTNSNSAEITSNNATVTVTYASLSSITISPAEVSMPEETSTTLTATFNTGVDPSTAVTWTSSDSNVASVTSEGVVTAHKEGTATITCKATATPSIYGESEITVENVSSTGVTVTFTLGPIGEAEASLDTTSTASSVPAILINRSNIDYTRVGLASSPSKSNNRTAKLNTPTPKDATKYVELRFDVASGYTFNPTNVAVIVANVSDTTAFDFELADANYSVTASCLYSTSTTGDTRATVNMPNADESKKMTGTVSLKIWPYGYSTNNTNTAEAFRFGNQIVITGNVQAAYADAIYEDGAWKYGRTPDENRRITTGETLTISTFVHAKEVALTGANAQLEITPTGTLMVDGNVTKDDSQTAVGDVALRSTKAAGTGALIMNPANVTVAPKATIEQATKTGKIDGQKINQYIGTPFSDGNGYSNWYGSYAYYLNAANNSWVNLKSNNAALDAFKGYMIMRDDETTFWMQGTLVKPTDADTELTLTPRDGVLQSNLLANSWSGPIDIEAMETTDFEGADATIYLFNAGTKAQNGVAADDDDPGQWVELPVASVKGSPSSFPITVIPSMQGFIVLAHSDGDTHTVTLNYDRMVYQPAKSGGADIQPNRAPEMRQTAADSPEVLKLIVSGESGASDNVLLFVREDFTTGFDNGWDGRKMTGSGWAPKMYAVSEDGNMAIHAVPAIEGTVIGFRAGQDNNYTFTFRYEGNDVLYLNDMLTETSTRIHEGFSYDFTTADGDIETRFVISHTPFVKTTPTGMDNVQGDEGQNVRKLFYQGVMYIIRNGRIYNAEGARIQ